MVSCLAVVAALAAGGDAQALPVSSGLILNLQANNIDGLNNTTLTDGQDISLWVDVPVGLDNLVPHNATANSILNPYVPSGQGTPNFVDGAVPSVSFTKVIGSPNSGDALGFTGPIGLASGQSAFTAFVVGDFDVINAITRYIQFGDMETGATPDRKIVALTENSFRFNGGSRTFDENLQTVTPDGSHVGTYIMSSTDTFGDVEFRVDGVDATPNGGGNLGQTLNLDDEGYMIGLGTNGVGNPIDFVDGNVNAIILYNRVLSASEIDEVESFLAQTFPIPEPSALALWIVAAAGIATRRRFR